MRTVWLDTPDGALRAAALALAETRDGRHPERLAPTGDPWPPGAQPPPAPHIPLPAPLIPWAAFEGRAVIHPLAGGASMTVVTGAIRAVADSHPVARLLLEGPESTVAPLALTLAARARVAIPRATLAAEALALARGDTPPARRLGAPALAPGMTVGDAFAHIVGHLTDVLLHWSALVSPGAPEPVHQARVALRRLRSALSVFARATACPDTHAATEGLRVLGRLLGPARDWDVFTGGAGEQVGAALPDDQAVTRLRQSAERRRQLAYRDLRAWLDGPESRILGLRLALLAGGTAWRGTVAAPAALDEPLDRMAVTVLAKRLKRLADPGGDVSLLPADALHALRLDGKRLRYAAEFFAPLFPGKATRRYLERLSLLQERLGVLNDGAVAAELMAQLTPAGRDHAYAVGTVRGFVAARALRARPRIAEAWAKLRREEPFWG